MPATRFAVVVETGPTSFSAHIPDIPGCVAAAKNRAKLLQDLQAAVRDHVSGLEAVPTPHTPVTGEYVEVDL